MEVLPIFNSSILFLTLYAEVFLLLSFLHSYDAEKNVEPVSSLVLPEQLPSVAIVIPCFNEEKTVAKSIESLLALSYSKDRLEILVVDDGSMDQTFAIASQYCTDSRVHVFRKENGGKHSALNFALAKSTADIIGCLDADSTVAPESLLASIAQLQATGAQAVTPAILVERPRNLLQLIQRAEYALSVFIRRAFSGAGAIFITPGPFSLFRRDVIVAIGGWKHAHGTEDLEIGLRLQQHHYRITNTTQAKAMTQTPDTFHKLYRQRVRWVYGFLMNALDYRHMFFNRRHGALGVLLLPAAVFAIFTALIFFVQLLWQISSHLFSFLMEVSVVGVSAFSDSLLINASTSAILMYVLMAVTVLLVFVGKRLSHHRVFSFDLPLFFVTYGLIAPVWLFGALVRATLKIQAPWR